MQTGLQCRLVYTMNTATAADPLLEGATRVIRAHSRDGLAELGYFVVFAGAAGIAAAKLWWPGGAGFAMALLAFSFLVRHGTDRIRQRIGPARTGYVGQGSLRPSHLLFVAIPGLVIGLLFWLGFEHPGVPLLAIASFLGGLEILKGSYSGVPRMAVLGAFAIVLAAGLALSSWGFVFNLLVWCAVMAAIYLALGSWLLWSYLK